MAFPQDICAKHAPNTPYTLMKISVGAEFIKE